MTQPADGDPYHNQPPQPPASTGSPTDQSDNTRMWGTFCHLAGLSLLLGVPAGNIVGPLVVWVLKKDESHYVDEQGKNALNFQISWMIWMVASALSMLLLVGLVLLPLTLIAWLVLTIVGTVRASRGEQMRYPLTIRFLS
jgi:uncharacterized protein